MKLTQVRRIHGFVAKDAINRKVLGRCEAAWLVCEPVEHLGGHSRGVRAKQILKGLSELTDVSKWIFVFAPTNEIQEYYNSLKLKGKLNPDFGTSYVYIVDKKRNLRGRKDKDEYKEGYDTFSPSDLYNEMTDDVKVILAEYRLALKRNNAKRQI